MIRDVIKDHRVPVTKARAMSSRFLGTLWPIQEDCFLPLRPQHRHSMPAEGLYRLAVPGVCVLIAFLSYGSQVLFRDLDPGPLTSQQKWVFNMMVGGIWICYARAIVTDAGAVPVGWAPEGKAKEDQDQDQESPVRQRHCRRCEALKPPRSHHCKVCER